MLDPAHAEPSADEAPPLDPHEPPAGEAGPPPRRRTSRHFRPIDRPLVWVRHDDGYWHAGRLHAWIPHGQTDWMAIVTYHIGVGLQCYRGVPSDWVTPNDTGVGHGKRPGVQDEPHPDYDPDLGRVVPASERQHAIPVNP